LARSCHPVREANSRPQTVAERGGNPEKIRESQRRRHADPKAVDEVIALFEDHRTSELMLRRTAPSSV
jgi:hypothetical protein